MINCNEIQQTINQLLISFQNCNKIKNSDLRKLVELTNAIKICNENETSDPNQDLSNFVTLNTPQTITGQKTLDKPFKVITAQGSAIINETSETEERYTDFTITANDGFINTIHVCDEEAILTSGKAYDRASFQVNKGKFILSEQKNGIGTSVRFEEATVDSIVKVPAPTITGTYTLALVEDLQTMFNSLLVNDLVTGGTTKALTAEQGKILNELILANTILINNSDLQTVLNRGSAAGGLVTDFVVNVQGTNQLWLSKGNGLGELRTLTYPVGTLQDGIDITNTIELNGQLGAIRMNSSKGIHFASPLNVFNGVTKFSNITCETNGNPDIEFRNTNGDLKAVLQSNHSTIDNTTTIGFYEVGTNNGILSTNMHFGAKTVQLRNYTENIDIVPSLNTAGTQRYRTTPNGSYLETVMQTGATTYEWTTIVQHNW